MEHRVYPRGNGVIVSMRKHHSAAMVAEGERLEYIGHVILALSKWFDGTLFLRTDCLDIDVVPWK